MLRMLWLIVVAPLLISNSAYSGDKCVDLKKEMLVKLQSLSRKTEVRSAPMRDYEDLLKSIQHYDTLISYAKKNYDSLNELRHLKYLAQSKQYNVVDDTSIFSMINGLLISQLEQNKKEIIIASFQNERDSLKQAVNKKTQVKVRPQENMATIVQRYKLEMVRNGCQ